VGCNDDKEMWHSIYGIINLCVFGNVFGCEEYGKI